MGRRPGPLSLRLIENVRQRKKTFQKRKASLKKKLQELLTLCDVDGFMIVSDSDGGAVETWPENQALLSKTLERYLNASTSASSSTAAAVAAAASNHIDDSSSSYPNPNPSSNWEKHVLDSLDATLNKVNRRIQSINSNAYHNNTNTPPANVIYHPSTTFTPPLPPLHSVTSSGYVGLMEFDDLIIADDQSPPNSDWVTNNLFADFEKSLDQQTKTMFIQEFLEHLNSTDYQSPFPYTTEYQTGTY